MAVLLQVLYETGRFSEGREALVGAFGGLRGAPPASLLLYLSLALDGPELRQEAEQLILELLDSRLPWCPRGAEDDGRPQRAWPRRHAVALLHLYLFEVLAPSLSDPSHAARWIEETKLQLPEELRSSLLSEMREAFPPGAPMAAADAAFVGRAGSESARLRPHRPGRPRGIGGAAASAAEMLSGSHIPSDEDEEDDLTGDAGPATLRRLHAEGAEPITPHSALDAGALRDATRADAFDPAAVNAGRLGNPGAPADWIASARSAARAAWDGVASIPPGAVVVVAAAAAGAVMLRRSASRRAGAPGPLRSLGESVARSVGDVFRMALLMQPSAPSAPVR